MDETNDTQQPTPEAAEQAQPTQVSTDIPKDARTWAMFCHLASLAGFVLPAIGSIIGPLVVWQLKKDEHPFIDENGKEALNFNISFFIYTAVAALSLFVCIGVVLLPVVSICYIVLMIIATIKANNGQHWSYPYIIRFIK